MENFWGISSNGAYQSSIAMDYLNFHLFGNPSRKSRMNSFSIHYVLT